MCSVISQFDILSMEHKSRFLMSDPYIDKTLESVFNFIKTEETDSSVTYMRIPNATDISDGTKQTIMLFARACGKTAAVEFVEIRQTPDNNVMIKHVGIASPGLTIKEAELFIQKAKRMEVAK